VTLAVAASTIANPIKVICASRAGSVPPVSADRLATATVTTTGASSITFGALFAHFDGIIFNAGTGATAANINLSNTSGLWLRFDNCSLRLATTASTSKIRLGSGGTGWGSLSEWNNTTVSFGAVGQTIEIGASLKWHNTPSALSGSIPTVVFTPLTSEGGFIECIGVDFSAAGSGKTLVGGGGIVATASIRFIDCKLDAAVTKSAVPTAAPASHNIDFIRCASSGVNYTVHHHRMPGLLIEETTIVRTGGASDGTTTIAWKIVTTANCAFGMPFECPAIAIWNDTTGSAVTATVEGIWGGGAVPNDDDIWLDVEYLGDASSPQGSFVNDGKADLLATAAGQTSSSETWGGSTTKFKLVVAFTPQMKGWCYCRVKVGRASTTMYIDPLCVLS
jgi:hypothetical protein